MSMVFMLIIAPFAFLIVHFTTKLLFDNKEAIIMMQDKIMERKKEPVIDDLIDEVKKYDIVSKPITEMPNAKQENKAVIHKPTGREIELRNSLLKCLAVIGLAASWLLPFCMFRLSFSPCCVCPTSSANGRGRQNEQ